MAATPRFAPGSRPARGTAWAGALALAVAALLFTPLLGSLLAPKGLTVVVVDASASAVRPRSNYAAWVASNLAEQAERASAAGRELALIRCAEQVDLIRPPSAFEPGEPLRADLKVADLGADLAGTDLAGAVQLAAELLAGRPGELVLLGDGSFTGRDPGAELWRLRERGLGLLWVPPPAPDRPDLAVAELWLPARLTEGSELTATVILASRGGALPQQAGAQLVFERRGARGPEVLRFDLELGGLEAGAELVRQFDLGRPANGRTEVSLRAVLDGGDAVPENDRAVAWSDVGEVLHVAAIHGFRGGPRTLELPTGARAKEAADFTKWGDLLGALPGTSLVHTSPEGFARLGGDVDVVVSFGVPLARGGPLGCLDFVAAGGGWLAVGGHELFAPGAAESARAGVEDFTPLLAQVDDPRRVLFLVDGSGSMAGEPFGEVTAAVLGAMSEAPATDRFELWVFTDGIDARHSLGSGGPNTAEAARELLQARIPRGATDVTAALGEVLAQAPGGSEPLAGDLVLLLTDGRDQGPALPLEVAAAELRSALGSGRLTVVGVGASRDEVALSALAGGSDWLRAEAGLADLLRAEVGAERWLLDVQPRAVALGTLREAPRLAGALRGRPLPEFARASRARLAPGAEAILTGADGHPLLAARRVGAGFWAALASAPIPGYAEEWAARPELLQPLLQSLGRTAPDGLELRMRRGPDGEVLELRGLSEGSAAAITARTGELVLQLTPPMEVPGGDPLGVRVGRAGGDWNGSGRVALEGASGAVLASLPWPGPLDSEFSPQPRGIASVFPLGGGATEGGSFSSQGSGGTGQLGGKPRTGHPAAPWLLGAGLLLTALAVALGWDRR